jgi:hypothetical protein
MVWKFRDQQGEESVRDLELARDILTTRELIVSPAVE